MPEINGHNYEPGCYVDGRWGQYGASRVLRVCDDILDTDYSTEALLSVPDDCLPEGSLGCDEIGGCEEAIWIADEAETALNNATDDGYVWHWHDGEFFLSPICDDETTCEDETCAHWC